MTPAATSFRLPNWHVGRRNARADQRIGRAFSKINNEGDLPLRWHISIRQTHRWLSIVFTATVIANFIAMALGEPPPLVVYSPLPPLFLLLFSGLYLFMLPYIVKWRDAQRTLEQE